MLFVQNSTFRPQPHQVESGIFNDDFRRGSPEVGGQREEEDRGARG